MTHSESPKSNILPGEAAGDCAVRDKKTISVPSSVEDMEAFMEQFVESFEKAHGITVLKKRAEGNQ